MDGTAICTAFGGFRARRRLLYAIASAVAVLALAIPAPSSNAASAVLDGPPTVAGPALDPALRARLDAALDQGFAASGLPGVTVGLWIPGQGEWVATRGVSDTSTSQPMDRLNQAKIGSVTKTMTGTIALQVIGEGRSGLTLDSTIDRWYPTFPEASSITVRMLLNMSSGIGDWGQAQVDMICADPYGGPTPDEVIALGATFPRAGFAPGQGFEYSGFNTFILGRILEKVTGSDLTTLMQSRLFAPLGMNRSRFAPDGVLAPPLTHGYTKLCPAMPMPTDATDWSLHEAWAAGAGLSTIDDLHTWGLALQQGYGLTPEMRSARADDVAPGSTYGLGVGVVKDAATSCVTSYGHSGAEPGYVTDLVSFPTSGAVFALQANGDDGDATRTLPLLQKPLYAVVIPVASPPPAQSCVPPSPTPAPTPTSTSTVVAVVATPKFTG